MFYLLFSSGTIIDSVLGQGPSNRPTEEESEDSAIMKLATLGNPPPLPPLSLYDLLEALQVSLRQTLILYLVYLGLGNGSGEG